MKKRILSLLLTLVLVLSLVPLGTFEVEAAAAGKVTADTAQKNLDELTNALSGKYFTVNQKACAKGESGHGCSNCGMVNVIKEQWLKNAVKRVPSSTSSGFTHYYYSKSLIRGQSCCGFANFAGWYIFSSKSSDTVTFSKLKDGSFNSATISSAKPGDILRFGNSTSTSKHSAIFVSTYSDGIVVLDCNWNIGSGNCKVEKHKIAYSKYKYVTISRAKNYDVNTPSTYNVELLNNYSGKNYMPSVEAGNFNSACFYSRNESIATVTADASVKRVGNCDSLKIVNTSAGSSGKDLVFSTYTNGRKADGAYVANQTLTLSFWAKASTPGAQLYFRWGYEDSYRSVTLTGDWVYYVVKMDRTADNNNHMHPYVDRAGTVWISELQLEEGSNVTSFAAENGGVFKTITATSGGKYTGLQTPARSGYKFDGWYTKAAGGTRIDSNSSVLGGNVRLYAHWTTDHVHSYVSSVTAPGCISAGYTAYTCSCGDSYTSDYTDALGHSYANGTCIRCGEKEPGYVPPHTHSYTKAVTEPTCSEKGYTTYSCFCGDNYVADITGALGHNYKDGICTRCGEQLSSQDFTDVASDAFYYKAVQWAVSNNITTGVGNNKFDPDGSCTRGQVVTFLWRSAGKPIVSQDISFTDVAPGAYYYEAVKWAVANDITTGVGNNKFDPDGACTRGQVVTFLWRSADKPSISQDINFTDVASGAYYYEAVKWAVANNITQGVGNNKFDPDSTCTRGQVVTFLYRAQ